MFIGGQCSMIFINPKTDFAFKKIFGSNRSQQILISFLNAIVYDNHHTIQSLEIINPYNPGVTQTLKDTYLDVRAVLDNGSTVIIEMQVLNVEAFEKRVIYNLAKAYGNQLDTGEGYRTLKQGQKVEFQIQQGPKGWMASSIRPASN